MNDSDGDRDLRTAFEALRSADLGGTPSFRRVAERWSRGPARRGGPAWGVVFAAVALFLVGLGPLRTALRTRAELRMARQVMVWRSPTEFLLDSRASDSISTIPAIGRSVAGSPLRALDPGGALEPSALSRSPQ